LDIGVYINFALIYINYILNEQSLFEIQADVNTLFVCVGSVLSHRVFILYIFWSVERYFVYINISLVGCSW